MREVERPEFAAAISIPTLLVIPGADGLVAIDAVEALGVEMRTGSAVIVPGARHEVLLENDGLRQLFWAGFDAFIPGEAPEGLLTEHSQDPVV
jgi:lysophospholipase